MRLRGRKDDTQDEIVEVLRAYGTVAFLANLGGGIPDLLFGCRWCSANHLIEVKDGRKKPSKRKLTEDEARWAREWTGEPVVVLESAKEAEEWMQRCAGRDE